MESSEGDLPKSGSRRTLATAKDTNGSLGLEHGGGRCQARQRVSVVTLGELIEAVTSVVDDSVEAADVVNRILAGHARRASRLSHVPEEIGEEKKWVP